VEWALHAPLNRRAGFYPAARRMSASGGECRPAAARSARDGELPSAKRRRQDAGRRRQALAAGRGCFPTGDPRHADDPVTEL